MNYEQKIDKIYDVVIRLEPMVIDHHETLYGNGKTGLKDKVLLLDERQEQHPKNCPAAKAASAENKKYGVALVMMIVAIVTGLVTTIMGIMNYFKP